MEELLGCTDKVLKGANVRINLNAFAVYQNDLGLYPLSDEVYRLGDQERIFGQIGYFANLSWKLNTPEKFFGYVCRLTRRRLHGEMVELALKLDWRTLRNNREYLKYIL